MSEVAVAAVGQGEKGPRGAACGSARRGGRGSEGQEGGGGGGEEARSCHGSLRGGTAAACQARPGVCSAPLTALELRLLTGAVGAFLDGMGPLSSLRLGLLALLEAPCQDWDTSVEWTV